jgi:general secretion pathway protein C
VREFKKHLNKTNYLCNAFKIDVPKFISTFLLLLSCSIHSSTWAQSAEDVLQVLGAVVSNKGGVALVKNRITGQVKAYKTGENLWGLGTLLSVDRQLILVLEPSGQIARISGKLGGALKKKLGVRVYESTAEKHIEDGFQRIGNKIEVDVNYKERMLREELPNILMQASSEPVVVGGEIIGFRLFQFEPQSIFGKLGMKDGDIVKEINGVALNNVAKTIQLLNGLRQESNVSVQVLRDGQSVQLDLNVK